MTNRLFISVDFPPEIISKIISLRDKIYGKLNPPKWEKEEKLHLTLKFLGEVEEKHNKPLLDLINEIPNSFDAIELKFDRFGLFYREKIPRILWLGLYHNQILFDLFSRFEESLFKMGFPKEKRKFNPHLTLLRIRGYEKMEKIKEFLDQEIPLDKFKVKSISLVKSELLRSGSIYSQLGSYKF